MARRVPDWESGKIPPWPLKIIYGGLDDALCFASFMGYKPAWYREWWDRPPYVDGVIPP